MKKVVLSTITMRRIPQIGNEAFRKGDNVNPNFKNLISAYRSGDYKQTRMHLKDYQSDRFCATGVACELYRQTDPEIIRWRAPTSGFNMNYDVLQIDRENMAPIVSMVDVPEPILDWYGITTHTASTLQSLNDLYSMSFGEIADVIESQPEAFFHYDHTPMTELVIRQNIAHFESLRDDVESEGDDLQAVLFDAKREGSSGDYIQELEDDFNAVITRYDELEDELEELYKMLPE